MAYRDRLGVWRVNGGDKSPQVMSYKGGVHPDLSRCSQCFLNQAHSADLHRHNIREHMAANAAYYAAHPEENRWKNEVAHV